MSSSTQAARAGIPHGASPVHRLVIFGDFSCPWSYLASRRAALLAGDGVEVDWRAIEHDPGELRPAGATALRFRRLQAEMDGVLESLRPAEHFPYALAGFVP